jgi:hypothetical protein
MFVMVSVSGSFLGGHPDTLDALPDLSRRQQLQVRPQCVVNLAINLFREDLFAASLADWEFEFGDRECVQSAIVANFGLVVTRCHDDLLLATVTAALALSGLLG